jgi:MFS family permease
MPDTEIGEHATASSTVSAQTAAPSPPRRWAILIAAALAFMAAQGFGRFGITLILPPMRDGLGLSNGEMGLLAGVGFVAYLLSSAPSGALAARFGTRPVVALGLSLIGVGLAATGLVADFVGAAVALALVGVGGPAAIGPVLAVGGAWFSPGFRGRATGLVVAGGGLGILLTGLLVPVLLGPADGADWRRAWWGLGAGVMFAAVIAALILRDPSPSTHAGRASLGQVYRSAAIWRLGFVFMLYGISYIVYGTFFGAHLAHHGVGAAEAGRLWSLAGLVSVSSGLIGGMLADRLGPYPALAVMFAVQGAGLAALAVGDSPAWYTLSAVLYGLSLWGFPSAISKAAAEIVGPSLAPAALGLLVLTFGVGQVIGPVAAGALADWSGSLTPGLLVAAGADATGGLIALLLPKLREKTVA